MIIIIFWSTIGPQAIRGISMCKCSSYKSMEIISGQGCALFLPGTMQISIIGE